MSAFQANLRKRIVGDEIFTGAGLDDLESGGTHTLDINTIFTIIIDGTGTPDTFKWKKGSGAFNTAVAITGAIQTLSDGVTVAFGATTGHTVDDQWEILTTNFGIDAILSDNGKDLDITEHSNYILSTDVGHLEADFESTVSRILVLVLPDKSIKSLGATQTILPHWDTTNSKANSDTIKYSPGSVITDGVYEIVFFTFPTWSVTVDYVKNDMVVRNSLYFKATGNPSIGDDPAINTTVWTQQATIFSATTGQPDVAVTAKYYNQGKVTLVFNIKECIDKKVFDSNCDISKNCTDDFPTDLKQVNLWKIMLTLRAIKIANRLKEFDKSQQLVEKGTLLCGKCSC